MDERDATGSAEEAAAALADRVWERYLELQPLLGTYIGDERFDDRLPDPSDEGVAREEAFHRGTLAELATVDRLLLPEDLRTTLDLMEFGATRALADIGHRIDRLQAVSYMFGPSGVLADIASLQRADTPERADRYIGRLRAVPE